MGLFGSTSTSWIPQLGVRWGGSRGSSRPVMNIEFSDLNVNFYPDLIGQEAATTRRIWKDSSRREARLVVTLWG